MWRKNLPGSWPISIFTFDPDKIIECPEDELGDRAESTSSMTRPILCFRGVQLNPLFMEFASTFQTAILEQHLFSLCNVDKQLEREGGLTLLVEEC